MVIPSVSGAHSRFERPRRTASALQTFPLDARRLPLDLRRESQPNVVVQGADRSSPMVEKAWKKLATYVMTLRSSGRAASHKSSTSRSCCRGCHCVNNFRRSTRRIPDGDAQECPGVQQRLGKQGVCWCDGRSTERSAREHALYQATYFIQLIVVQQIRSMAMDQRTTGELMNGSPTCITKMTYRARPSDQLNEKSCTLTSL